ncbi:toprim domain-containing protein [Salinicola sp. NYA28a]|jgi:putative DNA primase/helicase
MTPQKRTPTLGGARAVRHTFGNQIAIETKLADDILTHTGLAVTPVADGSIRRFDHPDKGRGNKRVWYSCRHDFGCWGVWGLIDTRYIFPDADPDPEAARKARERAEEAKHERQAERERQQALTASLCRSEWPTLPRPNPSFPYALRKRVEPLGLRQQGDKLVVPLTDGERLVNWQTIDHDGGKRFRPGGRVKGCYHPIGAIHDDQPLLIAEGWATGATLNMATGYPVACAMNAGNLRAVAESLRARYPAISIIVCGDNDHQTAGNPGITKAKDAAAAVGGRCIWPEAAEGVTDFNDAMRDGREVCL